MNGTPDLSKTAGLDSLNVALAHHWFMSYRGGEKVIERIANLFPNADVFTLAHDANIDIPGLRGRTIHTSRINRLPQVRRVYRHLLPVHPWAISNLKVPADVDLLLSSDASLIKGISFGESTKHVCYCHSPPRYLWELGSDYKRASFAARTALDWFADSLRAFDKQASTRVDHFIANSKFVAGRIRNYYQRDSVVIYPPVATDDFVPDRARQPFHLVISELAPYKRIDIAVNAYNRLGKRLVVIGDGSEKKHLQSIAKSNIEFLGRQPFTVLKEHFETCEAFVFPGIEDFGITPVEAQASGAPVIALRAGGALETVNEGSTGVFFDEQSADALADAATTFRPQDFDSQICRRNSERFSSEIFEQNYLRFLTNVLGKSSANSKPTQQLPPQQQLATIVSHQSQLT